MKKIIIRNRTTILKYGFIVSMVSLSFFLNNFAILGLLLTALYLKK